MKQKNKKTVNKNILQFICESGLLKRVERSGWSVLGIKNGESVAEHSFRCAVLGYLLSRMEKKAPYKAVLMAIFNDIHEARITDLHKMAQRYFDAGEVEDRAFYEQVENLPETIRKELSSMREEYKNQETPESIIARDADILECLIQAKEYYEHGFTEASKFMKKAPRFLKTKSAKAIWGIAKKNHINDWWFRLSDFKR